MAATASAPSAAEHAATLSEYLVAGEARAHALNNRGPLTTDADGKLTSDIVDAYWRHGFYVFEGLVEEPELGELRAEVDAMLSAAPPAPETGRESRGIKGSRYAFKRSSYRYARPLADPVGGTNYNKGRHPVRMVEPKPDASAPAWTVERLMGNLQTMDSCLRLYGHCGLLTIAEALAGPDFVPYNEVTFVKEPGLGPSVAWHQDGTTHWESSDWDAGAHGFNSMTQLFASTAANGVWVLPGSQGKGKADIRAMVAANGSECLPEAVPLLANAGDICVVNRQCVHGSFPNSSAGRRITLNAGFFPRKRVLGVSTQRLDGAEDTYDQERVEARCKLIPLAIDARSQHYPDAPRYSYAPAADAAHQLHWSEETRQSMLRDYDVRDMYL